MQLKLEFVCFLGSVVVLACGDGEGFTGKSGARGTVSQTVAVDAGKTVVGFARGVLRQTVDTERFAIMKYPVTKKQYKECVAAGACGEPKLDECPNSTLPAAAMNGPDDAAALCVGYSNAKAYCGYVGGTLPKFSQWLRAARGADVKAYPWGNKRASCAQHPRSYDLSLSGRPDWAGKLSLDGCPTVDADSVRVGQHTAGASPYQIEDVLIASGELVEGEAGTTFNACGDQRHCLALSYFPGRIDSVGTYSVASDAQKTDNGSQSSRQLAPAVWSFRCVVGG